MKNGLAKRLPVLLAGIVMLFSSGVAMAYTKPYIKGFGGDLMTGGWFNNGIKPCASGAGADYQDPNFFNSTFSKDSRNGGVLTYTRTAQRGGDSWQYAAFSVGQVDTTSPDLGDGSGDGFYSSDAVGGLSPKALTYANTDSTLPDGGVFEGNVNQGNCIPDYYSKKPASTKALNNLSQVLGIGSGDYEASTAVTSTLTLTNGSCNKPFVIPPGDRIALFVSGNVYINCSIVYDSTSTVDNVPKFALIVKGSIYIDSGAKELDGMYVAQPVDDTASSITADTGIIWTCHPNNTSIFEYTYPPVCSSPLVVNGALIAKQINAYRVNGDITTSNVGEDNLSTVSNCLAGTCNLSEVVNYTPAMVMGGSFFSTSSSGSGNTLPIDSLISLPPVF